MTDIFEDLKLRGLIENTSDDKAIIDNLENKMVSFYCGFDPTSTSLQIGNFLSIVTMMRLQKAGHRPICLIGGATGMIGDPSGKNSERNLLDQETLQENIKGIKKQLEKFLDFNSDKNSAILVNNYDWFKNFTFLDFMREVGKRFRLSDMLAKDSVKSRLASEAGISLTEFSYQTIQAYDFTHLNSKFDVTLQIGGGDQWGNITAGIDLTRKINGNQVFGMVTPLVTDANGKKFGKSEGGTIFLDPEKTSPYQMYQYLLNSDDKMVIDYLKFFTFLSLTEIDELKKATEEKPHERMAQKELAKEVVKLIHGDDGVQSALKATKIFFGEPVENLKDNELRAIFTDVPSIELPKSNLVQGINAVELLAQTPLFKSKGEARRAIQQKGTYINNKKIESIETIVTENLLASETTIVIRKGKKNYCLIVFI